MSAVRAVTAPPVPQILVNAATSSPTMTELAGMLSDRQTLLFWNSGFSAAQLGVSNDGGNTVTYGKNFGGGSYIGDGLIETAGGEVLVAVKSRDGSAAGQVWRSTGWNKATADATSWTQVLTCSGPGAHPDRRWCFTQRSVAPSWSARPGVIFLCEYGTKVSEAITAGRDSGTAAVRAWMSSDDGVTWTQIFDLRDRFAAGLNAQLHVHGIAYDPWDDRVFITQGDGGFSDGGQCGVWYCNGEDLANPVWTLLPGTQSASNTLQVTTVVPLETCVLLLSDGGSPGGLRRVARRGYRRYGDFVTVSPVGNGVIGANAYANPGQPGAPVWLTFYLPSGAAVAPNLLVTQDGSSFAEAWRGDTGVSSNAPGLHTVVGPDLSGKVYGDLNLSGTTVLLAADYAPAQPSIPTPRSSAAAAASALLAQTYPAHQAQSTSTALTSGTVYVMKVVAEADAPLGTRNVRTYQNTASSGLTLAKAAVFDVNGNQLGVSADQSATFNGSGTAVRNVPVGSFALTKGSTYYIAFVVVGTTGPVMVRTSNSGVANAGLTGAALLWSTAATGAADMPASITPSSLSSQPIAMWFGLY